MLLCYAAFENYFIVFLAVWIYFSWYNCCSF